MGNATISSPRSSENTEKFVVRLPKGMRQHIAELAYQHHRSMNSEIVSRLEQSISVEQGGGVKKSTGEFEFIPKALGAVESEFSRGANKELGVHGEEVIRRLNELHPSQRQAVLTILFSING